MIKAKSKFTESEIHFDSDKNVNGKKQKSKKNKQESKNVKSIIDKNQE